MNTTNKNYFQFTFLLAVCLLVRFIPLRAPNVEPILATLMPISRVYGAFLAFSFAVLSILLYDVISGTLGVQTFFTVSSYGLLGLWSASYFRKRKGGPSDYVSFAIIGTLLFDALTGLTVGPLFFGQSFSASLIGQIPFTLLHLVGNIAFAVILSPAIYNFMVKKKEPSILSATRILNPKII